MLPSVEKVLKDINKEISLLKQVSIQKGKIFIGNIWFLDESDIKTLVKKLYELMLPDDENEAKDEIDNLLKIILDHFKNYIDKYNELLNLSIYYDNNNSKNEYLTSMHVGEYWLRPSSIKSCIDFVWSDKKSNDDSMFYGGTLFTDKQALLLKNYYNYSKIRTREGLFVVQKYKPFFSRTQLQVTQYRSNSNEYEDKKGLKLIQQFLEQHFKLIESVHLKWVIKDEKIALMETRIDGDFQPKRIYCNDVKFQNSKVTKSNTETKNDGSKITVLPIHNEEINVTLFLEINPSGYRLLNQDEIGEKVKNIIIEDQVEKTHADTKYQVDRSATLKQVIKFLNMFLPTNTGLWKVSGSDIELVTDKEIDIAALIYGPLIEGEKSKAGMLFVFKLDKPSIKRILKCMANIVWSSFADPMFFYENCKGCEKILNIFGGKNPGPNATIEDKNFLASYFFNALVLNFGSNFALDFCTYYGYMVEDTNITCEQLSEMAKIYNDSPPIRYQAISSTRSNNVLFSNNNNNDSNDNADALPDLYAELKI